MGKPTKKKTTGKQAKRATRAKNPLFEKNPKNFRIGGDIQPKRDLTRFVRWPRYILLQRQKRVLLQRLKVPPVINQFRTPLDRNQQQGLLKFLKKYTPETKKEKSERLKKAAENKVQDKKQKDGKKPYALKFGLNHITTLVEQKEV
jgi:large subunit ribosomal protein L7Ae